jgi:hypothetical protein
MSGLRLVVPRSSRDTLDEQQKQALTKIVEAIRDYPRNENISVELSERTTARFRIVDGSGDAMCSDGILLSELNGSVSDFDGLFRKIVADLQKAAKQLHSPVVSDAKVRVAVMRWDTPWFKTTVPGNLQQVAAEIVQPALAELSSPIDLHVFSDYQFDLFSTLQSRLGAPRPRLEEDRWRNMKTPAELLDLLPVQLSFLLQNEGNDALATQVLSEILLAKTICNHQFLEGLDAGSLFDGEMLAFIVRD